MLNICVNDYNIKFYSVDSERELHSIFTQFYREYIVLPSLDSYQDVLVMSISKGCESNYWGIGVLAAFSGIVPSIVTSAALNSVLIGYNFTVCLANLKEKSLTFEFQLDSLFVFARLYSNRILVLSEADIYVINFDGILVNSLVLDDVLEEYFFEADDLVFRTSSGFHRISLASLDVV